jgi:glutathione S-transferase
MKRVLYDLAAEDETLRFGPYCWRTKLALAHKNLSFETVPWRFTDKEAIAFSGQSEVPVLVDGQTVVSNSQTIAEYLEATYPNEASLFGEPPAPALTQFINAWTEDELHPAIARVVLPDVFVLLHPKDKAYFRQSREQALGMTLEELAGQRDAAMARFKAVLKPLRSTLKAQSFIAGSAPTYADHIVFGALQWGRLTSSTPLLDEHDRITEWMDAVLNTYGL